MKQKTVLTLVAAFVLTAGVVVTALSIVATAAQAKSVCTGEKDTRSCPNTVKERDTGNEVVKCLKLPDGSRECA